MATLDCKTLNDLEKAAFTLDSNTEICKKVCDEGALLASQIGNIIGLANSSGFLDGESYDKIEINIDGNGTQRIFFGLAGICQFQMAVNLFSTEHFIIEKGPCEFYLLQENGDKLLKEDTDALLIEGLVPF